MRKLFFLFATLLCLASCSDEILTDSDVATEEQCKPVVFEDLLKTIRISASSVENAPTGEGPSRTSLDGHSVLWDKGDKFLIAKEGPTESPSNVLRITLDSNGAGLGFKTTQGLAGLSSEINVKYDDLNVKIGGEDVTDKIITSNTKTDNPYKVGMTNSDEHYQYVAPNNEMWAKLYGDGVNKTFLLARSTSSNGILSPTNPAVITLTNIQYKLRLQARWWPINENSVLTNGASISGVDLYNVKKYEWLHGINSSVTLTSEPGLTYGNFKGEISSNATVDETTRAIYPTTALKSIKNDVMFLSLPETQNYAEESFGHTANVMMGSLDEQEDGSYHVSFKNMCGVLQLGLKGDCDLSAITVSDRGGRMLSGTASVPVDNFTDGISTDMISGGSNTVTLNCDGVSLSNDEEKVFDIVVPVGAFENGLDVEVRSKNGQAYRMGTTANNKITRNTIKKMPALSVEMIDCYDLENDAVKLFFSYPHYQTYGETSHFTAYASVFKNLYSHDTPNTVPLKWNGDESTTYTISITYKNDDGVNTTKTYTATGSSYDLDNLVPGKKYTYTITTGINNNTTVKTGSFYTGGQVRMGRIDDSWNCRDLGGWTGLKGKKIKYEWIYRCSSLNGEFHKEPSSTSYYINECADPANYKFHEASIQQILDLGFKSELDLRTTEAEENNSRSKGLSHSWSLAQNNTGIEDWKFFHIKTSGADNAMSNYSVVKDVAWIINEVINNKRPVAFHCRSGADRTGMVAIAIESLLGVAPGDLARDYELTNFSSEQPKAEGKNELRDRRADGKASNKEAFNFHKAIFVDDSSNPGTNYQEKMYYYLNKKFEAKGIAISTSDLDNFIKFMLGLNSYTHPSWATENSNSLESIFNHQ